MTVGIYMGWYTPELTTPQTRLQGIAVWEIVFFLLNALLFALIGLQLPAIVDGLSGISTPTLIRYAVIVTLVVIASRFAWIFLTAYLPRLLKQARARRSRPSWQSSTVLAWSGMRGAVSLAAALALPLTTDLGSLFPDRDLIVFLTFAVILGTLVIQGLTLPGVIRLLDLEDDGLAEKEDAKARIHAAEAALARLEELLDEEWVREDTAERLRGLYSFRRDRFTSRFDPRERPFGRGAIRRLPTSPSRASGGRAPGRPRAPAHRPHRRRGHAAGRARPRPRGRAPGALTASCAPSSDAA